MTTGGRRTGSVPEDELLSRLYRQVTGMQAARFAAGYDIAAGLDRYRAWLREHAGEDQVRPEAIHPGRHLALRDSPGDAGAGAAAPGAGQAVIAVGTSRGSGDGSGEIPDAWAGREADRAVTALYRLHYRSLVRLAALLVRDIAAAEELVQDSFVAVHAAWWRLRDSDHALSYLRQSVVNRSRSALRRRAIAGRLAPEPAADPAGGEQETDIQLDRSAMVSVLRRLPARQREVLVLRYYADLSEAQIAAAMGISRGAVKSHAARAMSSLYAELRRTDE
jgi:RNA polymerase sigma-70 factor (sigma-E family)